MNEIRKHTTLIELERLVNKILEAHTANANNNGFPHTYKFEFEKGTSEIEGQYGKTKNYYYLNLYYVDKNLKHRDENNILQNKVILYQVFYPIQIGINKHQLQEKALTDLLVSSLGSLIYLEVNKMMQQEQVEQARELLNKKPNLYQG